MGLLKKLIKKLIRNAFKPVTNSIKGNIGEMKVNAKLNPVFFDNIEHRQINNLIIVDENGKTHQIDHVEIRKNGIFCIETKNYSGWIFGSENQDQWTQVIYGRKYKHTNPIKQNRSHIYHLSKVLDNKYHINSVIVMANDNSEKIDVPYVIDLSYLRQYLKQYFDGTSLTVAEMDYIYDKLQGAGRDRVTNREHVQNIHDTQDKIRMNICPRCNGTLVLKSGKYGNFYGCYNYPKCKFTAKIQ